ncbi:alpha/beta fold hydrolase [Nonomuraea typhae]|uniref:Alpha/beta fold hydrolase n=1 Tax=Nonomuraea typhae TaxID=2603600 RepID=A0ABW7Z0E0_9ACTN
MTSTPVPRYDSVVHYEIEGAGPGLVLVHGVGGGAAKTFGNVAGEFGGTVIRPNLSGSGQTTDDGGELTLGLLSAQVIAAIEASGKGRVDLLGFSLGAVVSAATAAERPDLVRKLVLVGGTATTTGPRDRFNFTLWRDLLAADPETFKRFGTLQAFSPALLDAFGHEGLAQSLKDDWAPGTGRQLALSIGLDIRPLLGRIAAPTLVVGLSDDQAIPVEGSRALHAGIAGSRLVEVPGGHMDWLVQPGHVLPHVLEFLGS